MHYYIITGTSSGIGESLAYSLIKENNTIFCISRRSNDSLIKKAKENDIILNYYNMDLTDSINISKFFKVIENTIDFKNIESVSLINNSGSLDPIGPIQENDEKNIINNISINLHTPILMSKYFIKILKKIDTQKTIINISSGAARYPVEGWSVYCAAKAGLDMFSRVVFEEQKNEKYPTKIISFAPGAVDTPMQLKIRTLDEKLFKYKQKFVRLKKENKLFSTKMVTEKIIEILNGGTKIKDPILHIKDLL